MATDGSDATGDLARLSCERFEGQTQRLMSGFEAGRDEIAKEAMARRG